MQACKRSTPVFYRTVQRRINLGTLTSSYHPYSFRFTPTPFFSHCSFACSFSSRSNNKGQQGDGLKRSLMNGEILKVLTPQDEVRVIGPDGPIGIIPLHEALQKANEEELDLVLVDQKQDPPTCVIKNSHKEALEQKRRLREKKAATGNFKVKIKTLKLRPSIDPHDFNSKMKQAKKFLTQGHTLKMQVMLRRGMMPEQGAALQESVTESLEGYYSKVNVLQGFSQFTSKGRGVAPTPPKPTDTADSDTPEDKDSTA